MQLHRMLPPGMAGSGWGGPASQELLLHPQLSTAAPKDEERGQGGISPALSPAPSVGKSPVTAGFHPPARNPS